MCTHTSYMVMYTRTRQHKNVMIPIINNWYQNNEHEFFYLLFRELIFNVLN